MQDALARCADFLLVLVPRPRISWKTEGKFFNSASRDDHGDWLVAAHSVNQGFVARTDPLSTQPRLSCMRSKIVGFDFPWRAPLPMPSRSTTDFETRLLALPALKCRINFRSKLYSDCFSSSPKVIPIHWECNMPGRCLMSYSLLNRRACALKISVWIISPGRGKVVEIELAEVRAVAGRLDSEFEKAVHLIKSAVESRGKVVVVGVGKSGHVGDKIAATLTSTGSPAVVLNSLNALHGDLGVVSDGDVVLALSYSGETDELINILPAIARFDVKKIAITGAVDSTLAKASDAVLDVRVTQEACPLNLAPTSSTTAMLVLGDALAMVLLEARGFDKEDFARYHPAGRLGRALLLKVHQIMRGEGSIGSKSRRIPPSWR